MTDRDRYTQRDQYRLTAAQEAQLRAYMKQSNERQAEIRRWRDKKLEKKR